MTGAALQALATVGRAHGGAAQRAVSWLRANQNDDGGFGQFKGRDSNAQSTSYAVQGLLAAGGGGGHGLARADVPRPPPAKRRERGLLVDELADAGVGDRPGADGAERQATAARGRAEEQAHAREGGVRRRRRRCIRPGGGGKAGSKAGQGRAARQRRAARARPRPATPPRSSGRCDRRARRPPDGPREHHRAGGSRPRERRGAPEARAGVGRVARGSGIARAPVGDPQVRAAWALARRGIVRA